MKLNLDKATWNRVAFGDVVNNVNAAVRDADAAGIDRIVAMEHMDPGELKIQRWGSTDVGTTFTRGVKPGQTLFGKRRAYQRKVAYAEFEAVCSSDIYTFEADESQLLGEFLPFLVRSNEFFDHALETSAGSLSPRTNWRDLANFEFNLPPLDDQKRLADLLWSAEHHRWNLGELASAARRARSEQVEHFVTHVSGEEVRLGEVLEIVRGGSPRPINDYFTEDPGGLNWIKIGDVPPEGKYIDATAQRIKPEGLSKTRAVRPGDLLLSNSMSFGRPYIVRIDGCIHDGWLSLSDVKHAWRTDCLYYLLRTKAVQGQFRKAAGGSTVKNLNTDIVSRVTVVLPAIIDQDALVAEIDAMSNAVRAVEDELLSIDFLRSSLLDDIFGGN